jgi:two-component system chemotaxis response regulator CheB
LRGDGPIRVLLIQNSRLFSTLLSGALHRYRDIQVLAGASGVIDVRNRLLKDHPDVILLDLALPEPEALQLLALLREHYPVPIIACSGSSKSEGQRALRAIARGALDVVIKPAGLGTEPLRQLGEELAQKVRAAVAEARPVSPGQLRGTPRGGPSFSSAGIDARRYLIVVGASTGGTEAIRLLLSAMPGDAPAIAIVQHIPAMFTQSFAERLDEHSPLEVSEAMEGELLRPGHAVVARGDTHLTVRRRPGGWHTHYAGQRRVNRHCPSVDVLFDSAAEAAEANAVGVLLTGMGADGAQGLRRLRESGALTVAQDAHSCVVYGMPKVAHELNAVDLTGAPEDIPRLMIEALTKRREAATATPVR